MNVEHDPATEKQVEYLRALLDRNGWPTANIDASFVGLGATSRQCLGRVDTWLKSLSKSEASRLIDQLQ